MGKTEYLYAILYDNWHAISNGIEIIIILVSLDVRIELISSHLTR